MARSIRAAAEAVPLLILTARAVRNLAAELGGNDQMMHFLADLATTVKHPIGVNYPRGEGSSTAFIAPRGWGQERLAGWIAGHHAELEGQLGEIVRFTAEGDR